MDLLIVLGALVLLMFVAYRGFSVILFAPVAALLRRAADRSGRCAAGLHRPVHGQDGRLREAYFPVFLLGAVFGKVIELSGSPNPSSRR